MPIEASGPKEAFNLALDEVSILDIAFLHGCSRPTLCLLYEDHRKSRHVKTLVVDMRERELVPGTWTQNNVEFAASVLIAVPAPLHGAILIGSMSITYFSGAGGSNPSVEIPLTQITSWAPINADGTRYLLGDHRGTLYVLVLCTAPGGSKVTSLVIDSLGVTSISTSLNYLDNGMVYVGSAYGDSQLIKLHAPSAGKSEGFEVLDSQPNIGPIVDMCVVDNEKQGGQRQLVTCSGAYKDGSLKIIRSGIGIVEQVEWSYFCSSSSILFDWCCSSFPMHRLRWKWGVSRARGRCAPRRAAPSTSIWCSRSWARRASCPSTRASSLR